jgi:hypothetical protein
MFIAALFTTTKARCFTMDEWIKKMWYIYTLEYYSNIKKSKIMSFSGQWMKLKIIMFSKVSQAQKNKSHLCSLIWGSSQHTHTYIHTERYNKIVILDLPEVGEEQRMIDSG